MSIIVRDLILGAIVVFAFVGLAWVCYELFTYLTFNPHGHH
jgi:hypothetical protein